MSLPLYELCRPKSYSEVIGQDKAIKVIDQLRKRDRLRGNVLFFSGPSGAGKTTLARLMADEIAEVWNIVEIDAADVTMEFLRDAEETCRYKGMGEKWYHVFIINEAHRLRTEPASRMLTLFEQGNVQKVSTWILTTTREGSVKFDDLFDAKAFASRCVRIELSCRPGAELIASRLKAKAEEHGLDGKPLPAYVEFVKQRGNNWRLCYQDLEAGAMLD